MTNSEPSLGAQKDGILAIEINSLEEYLDFIRDKTLDYSHYFWRGQRDSQWTLESTLDRYVRKGSSTKQVAEEHLKLFKQSVRGRRGPNPVQFDDEDEWWALGQHHGLRTPLLDWTDSPFVALYFAFLKQDPPVSGKRAVWALGTINKGNARANRAGLVPAPVLKSIRPEQNENSRLVAQAGLFTRAPLGMSVDQWVSTYYKDEQNKAPLLKLSIENNIRFECLKTLNRMNINHLTLFPDIEGSSTFCNMKMEIDRY